MALDAHTMNCFNAHLGPNGAYNIVTAINQQSTSTPVVIEFGTRLQKMMRGSGETEAFKTALISMGTLSTAAMNILERILQGRGNAEAFKTAVSNGSA
jgi:hypothetical protein